MSKNTRLVLVIVAVVAVGLIALAAGMSLD